MLTHALAASVSLAGVAIYATALLLPPLARRGDILWSGLALFYGLVLWFCAQQFVGVVVYGQAASIALTGWLGWQAFQARWQVLTTEQRVTVKNGKLARQQLRLITQKQPAQRQSAQNQATQAVPQPPPMSQPPGVPPTQQPQEAEAEAPSDPAQGAVNAAVVADGPNTAQIDAIVAAVPDVAAMPDADTVLEFTDPDAETQIEVTTDPTLPDPEVPTPDAASSLEPEEDAAVAGSELDPTAAPDSVTNFANDSASQVTPPQVPVAAAVSQPREQTSGITPKGNPVAASQPAQPNLLVRLLNTLRGRKSHGKRYVRPATTPNPAADSNMIPSAPDSITTDLEPETWDEDWQPDADYTDTDYYPEPEYTEAILIQDDTTVLDVSEDPTTIEPAIVPVTEPTRESEVEIPLTEPDEPTTIGLSADLTPTQPEPESATTAALEPNQEPQAGGDGIPDTQQRDVSEPELKSTPKQATEPVINLVNQPTEPQPTDSEQPSEQPDQ